MTWCKLNQIVAPCSSQNHKVEINILCKILLSDVPLSEVELYKFVVKWDSIQIKQF